MIYSVENSTSPDQFFVTLRDHSDQSSNHNLPADNSSTVDQSYPCKDTIPYTWELFENLDGTGLALLCIAWAVLAVTASLYVEEIIFFNNYFRTGRGVRYRLTCYVLAISPVFSVMSLLGIMVPRAGPIVDLVSNTYQSLAMFQLLLLIHDYLGGLDGMKNCKIPSLRFNTPPCCCCCPCLPKLPRSRKTYSCLIWLVYQTNIIRPLLMLLAAVLWTNGTYIPGKISSDTAFIYINSMNIVSSLVAIWGLVLVQVNYGPYLAKYRMKLKFWYLKFTLMGTAVGRLVFGILVSNGVFPCTPYLSSTSRAQSIYHMYVILLMCLVTIWGRYAFRRMTDAPEEIRSTNSRFSSEPYVKQICTFSDDDKENNNPIDGANGDTPQNVTLEDNLLTPQTV